MSSFQFINSSSYPARVCTFGSQEWCLSDADVADVALQITNDRYVVGPSRRIDEQLLEWLTKKQDLIIRDKFRFTITLLFLQFKKFARPGEGGEPGISLVFAFFLAPM